MNKKIKKEIKRLEKKKRNYRLMAMAIAGGILASTAPNVVANADTTESSAELNVLAVSENEPVIDIQSAQFYGDNPCDLLFFITEYNGLSIDYVTYNGEKIPSEYISEDGIFIRLSKDYILSKPLEHKDIFTIGVGMSNGKEYDVLNVNYYYVPGLFDPSETPDDKEEIVTSPSIPSQGLVYDQNIPDNITIRNVQVGNATPEFVSFGDYYFGAHELQYVEGDLLVKYSSLFNLYIEPGVYDVTVGFSDGTVINSGLTLTVLPLYSEDDVIEPAPQPPIEDDNTDSEVTEAPSVAQQEIIYDLNNPTDIVIKDFVGDVNEIFYVEIQGNFLSSSDVIFDAEAHTLTIPVSIIEEYGIRLNEMEMYIGIKFFDGYTLNGLVKLNVINSSTEEEVVPPTEEEVPPTEEVVPPTEEEVVPPTEEDKPSNGDTVTPPGEDVKDEVEFDKNAPKDLEIPGLEIGNELVDSVVINGEEFDVEYKTSLVRASLKPSVYIVDGKLVVPVAVLEYLGLDSESLDITVNLANGKVLNKVVTLNVVDSSDKEDVIVPPTTDEDGDSSDEDESDKENGDASDKDEVSDEEGSSNNGTNNGTNNGSVNNGTNSGSNNNSSNNNGTVNNGSTNNGTVTVKPSESNSNGTTSNELVSNESVQSDSAKLPNTGAPISAGLVGGIITTVGAFLSRKRK